MGIHVKVFSLLLKLMRINYVYAYIYNHHTQLISYLKLIPCLYFLIFYYSVCVVGVGTPVCMWHWQA